MIHDGSTASGSGGSYINNGTMRFYKLVEDNTTNNQYRFLRFDDTYLMSGGSDSLTDPSTGVYVADVSINLSREMKPEADSNAGATVELYPNDDSYFIVMHGPMNAIGLPILSTFPSNKLLDNPEIAIDKSQITSARSANYQYTCTPPSFDALPPRTACYDGTQEQVPLYHTSNNNNWVSLTWTFSADCEEITFKFKELYKIQLGKWVAIALPRVRAQVDLASCDIIFVYRNPQGLFAVSAFQHNLASPTNLFGLNPSSATQYTGVGTSSYLLSVDPPSLTSSPIPNEMSVTIRVGSGVFGGVMLRLNTSQNLITGFGEYLGNNPLQNLPTNYSFDTVHCVRFACGEPTTTASPTTASPTIAGPTPTTASPTTAGPTPTTASPTTASPTTAGPTTASPTTTSPTTAGPANTDPANTDPANTDPANTDPANTDPANTDPANTDPANTDPANTDPANTDPANTDPANTDPANTDPANTDPANTDPANTDPANTGPLMTTKPKPCPGNCNSYTNLSLFSLNRMIR